MLTPELARLAIQGGYFSLVCALLWGAWKLANALLVVLTKAIENVVDSARKTFDDLGASVRSIEVRQAAHDVADAQRHGELREHVSDEAKDTRHEIKNALTPIALAVSHRDSHP